MGRALVSWWLILIGLQLVSGNAVIQEIHPEFVKKEVVTDVRISCHSEGINVTLKTASDLFDGLIYPKGLSKNSSCMTEYRRAPGQQVHYSLPLTSCNTMSVDVSNGLEYFNTIVVQPHRKLVTNQGKAFHIRCRYLSENSPNFLLPDSSTDVSSSRREVSTATMPGASMKIYSGEPVDGQVAESVKIGDPLTLVVGIDPQDIYGMHITDCVVRDGLGWSQQVLINERGCSVDEEILTQFEYSPKKTTALVRFQAHKFPYTASVYYQCSIRLCIRHADGCEQVPPVCGRKNLDGDDSSSAAGRRRHKRQLVEQDETKGVLYDTDKDNVRVKVFSGLYVNEASDLDGDLIDAEAPGRTATKVYDPNTLCIPQREFAIGIAIAGLLLIIIVIFIILILLTRRRRKKDLSTTASSIYSGPYTNTGYSSYSS